MGRLDTKTCIVTGAARGIGRGIAEALLAEGANVVFADLSSAVKDVAGAANDAKASRAPSNGAKSNGGGANGARSNDGGGRAIGLTVDVTDRAAVKAMIEETVATFGRLDVKFNNAGVNKPMNFLDVTEDNWNFIMKVNALGVLIGTQEAAKQMIAQGGGGKIVNTASVASRQGFGNIAPYCASKFAVLALTQSAARDLAPHGITVNGFAPGVVNTPLWEQLDKDLMDLGASERPGQAIEDFSSGILLKRAATPKDIVGTTTFLASADSDYMTGQIMMIDGGMILV